MNAASDFPEPTRIPVNGIELEVLEAGRENAGRPVVLAHGWPELAYTWRHQVPALVAAGYHVIVPNQRGYGGSSRPAEVEAYDIEHLTGDLVGLLDHYGYEKASFIGHDWGAMVVWGLALLHPERVSTVVNLSLPYQERGELPWIELLETVLGPDYYFVHFNRQPGVADAVLDANTRRFLRNLFRKNEHVVPPQPGMAMIDLALAEEARGEPTMSEDELEMFVVAFETTGFTSSINWYRNLDRNWSLLAEVDPIIAQPALMIYGDRDVVQQSPTLARFVPRVEVATLEAGHWIPEERPHEVTELIVGWLAKHDVAWRAPSTSESERRSSPPGSAAASARVGRP